MSKDGEQQRQQQQQQKWSKLLYMYHHIIIINNSDNGIVINNTEFLIQYAVCNGSHITTSHTIPYSTHISEALWNDYMFIVVDRRKLICDIVEKLSINSIYHSWLNIRFFIHFIWRWNVNVCIYIK